MQFGAHAPVPVERLAWPQTPTQTPEGQIAPREVEELQTQPAHRPGVIAVWRDALSTFSAHSAAILTFALAGFWGVSLIGALAKTMLQLDFDVRLDGASTVTVLPLMAAHEKQMYVIVLIQAVAGMLAFSFARGIITWFALRGSQPRDEGKSRESIGQAMRMTLARYPALLVGSLLYGALITAGIAGLSELTQPLKYTDGKLAHMWAEPAQRFGYGIRQLAWRSLNTLLPDPGPPLAGFEPDLRHAVKQFTRCTFRGQCLAEPYYPEMTIEVHATMPEVQTRPAQEHWLWLLPFAGMLLIISSETLLRFRAVMAMKPPRSQRPRRFGWLTPLFAGVRFGLKHFGAITIHVWLVRLAIFALSAAFIEFPVAMADNLLMPYTMLWRSLEVLPIMDFLETSTVAVISAILLAFSIVYDVRLYLALSNDSPHERSH